MSLSRNLWIVSGNSFLKEGSTFEELQALLDRPDPLLQMNQMTKDFTGLVAFIHDTLTTVTYLLSL